MDKHVQIETEDNGYQVQMMYLEPRKVFDVGAVKETYEDALAAGAGLAERTGTVLLAWGYTIRSPADTAAIAAAARCPDIARCS